MRKVVVLGMPGLDLPSAVGALADHEGLEPIDVHSLWRDHHVQHRTAVGQHPQSTVHSGHLRSMRRRVVPPSR
jgi:hypothetical protein